jgi:3-oxoacyl-[acyl-carrier-protein] synthase-3
MNGAKIISFGHSVPEKTKSNQDIIDQGIDSTDEWITTRTGIKHRHIANDNETTSDLAYKAAIHALEKTQITSNQIDLIIVATSTPDFNGFPSTAAIIQHRLGAPTTCAAFDLSAACSGFTYAISTASQFIFSGKSKTALVIGADCLSKKTNWSDRNTCILFGDGAGAALLQHSEKNHIIDSQLFTDGEHSSILKVKHFIEMEGRAVFKLATTTVIRSIEDFLLKHSLTSKDIQFFVLHQANIRIIQLIQEKLGFTDSQTLINVDRFGNTSAASIPLALSEAYHAHLFKDNDLILTVGFGAGFTWGINLIKWRNS